MIDVGRDFERMRDYMVGRLSDDERRAFEDRLGRDPELVRELEQSLRLREGLLQLKAQGYFNRPAGRTSLGARVRGLKTQDWLPALAAAAVGALALFLWVQPRASGVLRAVVDSPVAAQFNFIAMRSGSSPVLTLPSAGPIELRVQPAAHATVSRFRVTLLRESEHAAQTPVGELTGLALGADDTIHFYADSARLAAGTYRLQVEPDAGANGAAESFGFTLRGSGAPAR
jgi:anti-sigma factor RsiW